MTYRITPRQFHEANGVEDWRVVFGGACAHFRTGSFGLGVALVDAIGRLADAASHPPDLDLRHEGVTVRLRTYGIDGISDRDVALARQISAAAHELEVPADPSAVQTVQITIDALVGSEVMPFWRAVLGSQQMGDEDLVDPHGRGPSFWFQEMDAPRPQRNRVHVDISVPHDQAEARIAVAIAADGGGRWFDVARLPPVIPSSSRNLRTRTLPESVRGRGTGGHTNRPGARDKRSFGSILARPYEMVVSCAMAQVTCGRGSPRWSRSPRTRR